MATLISENGRKIRKCIGVYLYFSEEAKVSESNDFDFTDEKFLAIAFGSATVLLLILIVIIVVSLVRRGHTR